MALAHLILGKFLGVGCHCFPPVYIYIYIYIYTYVYTGHAVAQLVEATSRKVAGSIPDGVIGIFHLHNPSGRTMAQGYTHPLTEMSTRSISWG